MTPLITFLMLYRGRDETDKALENLFVSLQTHLPRGSFEVLVRLDDNDLHGKGTFKQLVHLYNKINIRYFIHHRWEGRWSINYDYLYLFTYKNPSSKWVSFLTDDCIIKRNIVEELDEKFHLVGDFKTDMTNDKMNLVGDYKSKHWLTPEYICAYPLMSTWLAKVMCNMGYQVNIDSTLALLNAILYVKYGIIIGKHIPEFIIRDNVDRVDNWGETFNRQLLITDSDMPVDSFFFELMEQQAHNIYLSLTYGDSNDYKK